jgi:hypothetical protein
VNWNLRDWRREGEGWKGGGQGKWGGRQVSSCEGQPPVSYVTVSIEPGEWRERRKEADHRQQHPAAAATALVSPLVCTSRSDNGGEY